ncbi:helix-turn-helix transcriptional regulator [Microbacterium sp. NPDC077663]|uniref:helix-turn-helix transcriptional regulator n=1 Tax=Microbacterium sp. NPDC077663 TaxID=3364189 RepID=UPI0037C86B06
MRRSNTGGLALGAAGAQSVRGTLYTLAAWSTVQGGEFATWVTLANLLADVARVVGAPSALAAPRHVFPRREVTLAAHALREDLAHSWSVTDLAGRVSLSPSQLTRLFRSDLGITPAAYLRQLRTDRMADLLLAERLSVGEAASRAGWASPNHASRAFTARYGISPRRFVSNHSYGTMDDV